MDLFHYILFWVCVLGLCLGSFFNVVILRSLSGESIVFPASKCPKCNHPLYFWHNIPVLSYIFLGGKCYFCKEKISIQYPIVEIVTMLLFACSFLKFGISVQTLFVMLFISCFIIMTVTDLKEKLVDCNIAVLMAIAGMIYNYILGGGSGFLLSLGGLLAGVLVLELVARSGYLFVKSRAMGEGDTYVAGAIGAIVGLYNILPVLLYGLIASMLFIIPLFWYKQYKNNNKLTCALFILFAIVALLYELKFQTLWMMVALICLGIWLCISILKNITKGEKLNYLPYVPALAFGFLYFIFFC